MQARCTCLKEAGKVVRWRVVRAGKDGLSGPAAGQPTCQMNCHVLARMGQPMVAFVRVLSVQSYPYRWDPEGEGAD
jgi:hypothetical protein